MYDEKIRNRDKKEFDFENNRNCVDFNLMIDDKHNYDYSGSYCCNEFEFHGDINNSPYDYGEFRNESRNIIHRFMNRKSKKEYETDSLIGEFKIRLFNNESDQYEFQKLEVKLTYCP